MTSNHFPRYLLAAALTLQAANVAAQGKHIACSSQIQPQAIKVAAGAGWVPHVEFPLQLYSAGMSSGPPGSLLTLRGEELRRTEHVISTRYAFEPGAPSNQAWLDCAYGEGGEISISQRLSDRIRECTVTKFRPVAGEPRRIEIRCR
ncbi:STY0301 family protein [Pseudoduganella albidiflava]|uniref:Uncharacterized protein n=1 Tax=Pseudoduganella albidiflava TaxID=321983 RepID=A0ABX5RXH6_9BURK|nr:STY0301 family protein [Pseudoduganella albidiflava]QBI03241.1 hypothetical protein EYF70_22230 [Pseudoduganella albidiflava]